jgi:hypothetical protein
VRRKKKTKRIPSKARIIELQAEGFTIKNIAFIHKCSPAILYIRLRELEKPKKMEHPTPKKKLIQAVGMVWKGHVEDKNVSPDSMDFTRVNDKPYMHRNTGVGMGWMPKTYIGGRTRQPKIISPGDVKFLLGVDVKGRDDE